MKRLEIKRTPLLDADVYMGVDVTIDASLTALLIRGFRGMLFCTSNLPGMSRMNNLLKDHT